MPRSSTFGVRVKAPPADRTYPSSSSVSSSRRAVGRARPAAAATSVSDMAGWSASKQVRTSSPRARASTKSGPVPRPAMPTSVRPPGPPSAAEDALLAAGALGLVLVVGVLVRVLQDGRLGLGPFREHALLPDVVAAGALEVLDGRLDLAAHRRQVDADQLPVVLHHPAVDQHRVDVAALGLERDVPERVEQRERHRGGVVLDQDDVGLLAGLQAAEVGPAEGGGAAAGAPVDDLLGPQSQVGDGLALEVG